MSIHEEKHAAAAGMCQLNGVRAVCISLALVGGAFICTDRIIREQRRYRAFIYCEDITAASYEEWKHQINQVEDLLKPGSNILGRVCGWAHWRKFSSFGFFRSVLPASINGLSNLGDKIKRVILGFNACAVGVVKPGNKSFPRNLIFWMVRHKESPFCCSDKQRMDDGGRHGNVPPNAAKKDIPPQKTNKGSL